MTTEEKNARSRIIGAVRDIIAEGHSPERITVRQIAQRANVGIGTINYHFESRDKLMYEAVSLLLESMAGGLANREDVSEPPVERLQRFLITTSELLLQYREVYKVQISYELTQGDFNTPQYLLPLLAEIFGTGKNEAELKILAIQLVSALQAVFLRLDSFRSYTGIDIHDRDQLQKAVSIMIDNLIQEKGGI